MNKYLAVLSLDSGDLLIAHCFSKNIEDLLQKRASAVELLSGLKTPTIHFVSWTISQLALASAVPGIFERAIDDDDRCVLATGAARACWAIASRTPMCWVGVAVHVGGRLKVKGSCGRQMEVTEFLVGCEIKF